MALENPINRSCEASEVNPKAKDTPEARLPCDPLRNFRGWFWLETKKGEYTGEKRQSVFS